MRNKNYVLIGFMGAGKTIVGKYLARAAGADFLDTDMLIEKKTGHTVTYIFEKYGEKHFRELETDIIEELSETLHNTVLSVGGGLPVRKVNHRYLKKIGTVVYLEVSKETVAKRLARDRTRPLLFGEPEEVLERIDEMLQKRAPVYERLADLVIRTDALTVEEIVARILKG